jgi:hypothetical protein
MWFTLTFAVIGKKGKQSCQIEGRLLKKSKLKILKSSQIPELPKKQFKSEFSEKFDRVFRNSRILLVPIFKIPRKKISTNQNKTNFLFKLCNNRLLRCHQRKQKCEKSNEFLLELMTFRSALIFQKELERNLTFEICW